MRDGSRLLGLSFLPLHHPGLREAWTAPQWPAGLTSGSWATHCVILGALLPCHAGRLGPTPTCGSQVGLSSNTDHSSLFPSPEGHDFLSGLFVLKQSGVKIKPPRGPMGQSEGVSFILPPCPVQPLAHSLGSHRYWSGVVAEAEKTLWGLQLVSSLKAKGPRLLAPVLPCSPVQPRPHHPVARGGKSWC